jgi:hypothetical protein
MIKIYGKGDTVSNSEYWDGRTTYNGLTRYLDYQENTLAVKNIFNDSTEMYALLESVNVDKFYAGGILKTSFNNEMDISNDDYVSIPIGHVTRHYVRCTPGIASYNGFANINKPATELAVKEINSILDIREFDDEFVDIKFDYSTDSFKGKIHKIVNGHMEILEFTNGSDYDNDNEAGYNTGIELIHAIYSSAFLTEMFEVAIGDDLTKIDLELTKEVTELNTEYHWILLKDTGLIDLVKTADLPALYFDINYFTTDAANLSNGMTSFTNPHVYSLATEVISGDMVIGGKLTVLGATTTVESETVLIKDNVLVLNDGEVGAGVTLGSSGIEVDRGSLTNYYFIFDEATDSFKIGEIGSLQDVATKEDTPINTGVAFWNTSTNRFETNSDLLFNGTDLKVRANKVLDESDAAEDSTASSIAKRDTSGNLEATSFKLGSSASIEWNATTNSIDFVIN